MLKLELQKSKSLWLFLQKLEDLNKITRWALKILTRGKSPSIPWPWPNIGPINLIPTTFLNIQTSPGPVSRCLLSQKRPRQPWSRRLLCYVGSKFSFQVGLGIDATLDRGSRHSTNLFAQSQGISVMPQVVKSRSSKDLLGGWFWNRFPWPIRPWTASWNKLLKVVRKCLKRGARKARLLDWQCLARSGCWEPLASNSEEIESSLQVGV